VRLVTGDQVAGSRKGGSPAPATAPGDRRRIEAPRVTVTVGDEPALVDQALVIVHEGFVAAGYTEPRRSGRRMHPSYVNPGTLFSVAHIGGDPVGTVAMIQDGPFGLPCERAFAEEVDDLRAIGPVREVGSLVVDASWRRHTRAIYLHMLATMVRLVFEMDARTNIVLAVTPENARFTSGLFGCDIIAESRPLYGAPAVLLRTSADRLRECYREPRNSSRRTMRRLVFEPEPDWLDVHVSGNSWPREWLQRLLDEEGTLGRLRNQTLLLGWACRE
jgi:hypothetical protein